MKPLLTLLLILSGAPVGAQDIVSPGEFQSMSEGKTLYFTRDGQLFGIEQFYTRHRSTWQDANGECSDGVWQAEGNLICFYYENNPDKQCWQFLKTADGFAARAEGAAPDLDLTLSKVDTKPLNCLGPQVGA